MVAETATDRRYDLNEVVRLYLTRCRVEGKSPNTIRAYAETLGLFQRFAGEAGIPVDVGAITTAHIYGYLGRVAASGVSLETQHRRHRELRSFFSWLERMGDIAESPLAKIKNVRLPQKIVEPFRPEDVVRILAVCDSATAIGARDRAIVLLLLDSGLRLNELVQLELTDVDVATGRVRVRHGKGNKQRVAAFGGRAGEALLDYVRRYRGTWAGQLFRSARPQQPMTRNLIRVRMARLGRLAGVPNTHAHRFRHTFATWAIEQGARELDVQYLLGHSSPVMVRRYSATYNAEKAAQAHAGWSPGNVLAESAKNGAHPAVILPEDPLQESSLVG